jgi:glycosyltransferase involved in cell wall biosynthesis
MTAPMRVSVVIPTYNACTRLKATIESVLTQSEPSHDIIIVDDGSTDGTAQVCAGFGKAIVYLAVQNGGQQRARNIGVERAGGDWIAFLDHDDLWRPDYLAELQAFNAAHTVDLTFCDSQTLREQGEGSVIQPSTRFTELTPARYWQDMGVDPSDRWSVLERYDYAHFLAFHPVQPSVLAIRKELFLTLGGFNPRMRGSSAEDFEFELRALRQARIGLIWRPLVTIVRHAGNASVDGSKMAMDLVNCLRFALDTHGLTQVERGAAEAELQRRLPAAIDGAFTLRRFQDLRDYRALLADRPDLKTLIKCALAGLPRPIAMLCADALAR